MLVRRARHRSAGGRRGAAALDAVLVLAVVVAAASLVLPLSMYVIKVVYEIICTLVAWPFL